MTRISIQDTVFLLQQFSKMTIDSVAAKLKIKTDDLITVFHNHGFQKYKPTSKMSLHCLLYHMPMFVELLDRNYFTDSNLKERKADRAKREFLENEVIRRKINFSNKQRA